MVGCGLARETSFGRSNRSSRPVADELGFMARRGAGRHGRAGRGKARLGKASKHPSGGVRQNGELPLMR